MTRSYRLFFNNSTRPRAGRVDPAYRPTMNSRHLHADQVAKLRASVGRDLQYLNKLCERAKTLGWPDDDDLVRSAIRARDATQALAVAIRYAGGAHAADRADGR